MKPKQFKAVLVAISDVTVHHNKAKKAVNNFIVWAEVGKSRLSADNITAEAAYRYAVDFFTLEEYSEIPAEIDKILEENDIVITDYAVNFEEETGLTHYAYTVEV